MSCPPAPKGVPSSWVTDNNPGWADPKRQCDFKKLDPTVMKGAALSAYCTNPRGAVKPSKRFKDSPCLKVGRATTFGHQNDAIYKNPCWAYHCHFSFKKDSALIPKGALPVALSTKYLKDHHGRAAGVRGNPADCSPETWPNKKELGACQKCICARVVGIDSSMEGTSSGPQAEKDGTVGTIFKGFAIDRCGECEDEHVDVHVGDGKGGKSAAALKIFPSYRTKVPPWNMAIQWQFADCGEDCGKFFERIDGGAPVAKETKAAAQVPKPVESTSGKAPEKKTKDPVAGYTIAVCACAFASLLMLSLAAKGS
jgi:hypothetical protein